MKAGNISSLFYINLTSEVVGLGGLHVPLLVVEEVSEASELQPDHVNIF